MIPRVAVGGGVRTLRELGEALGTRSFRIALALSLLLHLVLLFALQRGGVAGGEKRVRLMRVQILRERPAPAPPAPPAPSPLRD